MSRCAAACTTRAGERIALIWFALFTEGAPWREVGAGIRVRRALPRAPGSRDCRANCAAARADESMDYLHNTLVGDEDLEPVLDRLLADREVATAHLPTVLPQRFLYAATR